jgi:hypothetical protein
VWSGHLPSWADFITTTPVFRFSIHTGNSASRFVLLRTRRQQQTVRPFQRFLRRGEQYNQTPWRRIDAQSTASWTTIWLGGTSEAANFLATSGGADDGAFGIDFNLASIPSDFSDAGDEPFDQRYMIALFDRGYDLGSHNYPWAKAPPNWN